MSKALTLLSLILISLTSDLSQGATKLKFKFTPPAPWKKTTAQEVDASWIIPDSPTKATITISTDESDSADDLKDVDESKLIQMVEMTRSIYFRLFGISDWKVDQHHFQGSMLEMNGHYVSTAGVPVHFVERDYFIGSASYTITFFEDSNGATKQNDKTIAALLDQFSPEEVQE